MAKSTNLRFDALKECAKHHAERFHVENAKISEYFGINFFYKETMRKYLSADAFTAVENAVDGGEKIDRKYADLIAAGMKNWAVERGATHYTHWFQPLNEATAEKHDAFTELDKNSRVFESFKGDLLVQQEPDASSFPSAGSDKLIRPVAQLPLDRLLADPICPPLVTSTGLCPPQVFA